MEKYPLTLLVIFSFIFWKCSTPKNSKCDNFATYAIHEMWELDTCDFHGYRYNIMRELNKNHWVLDTSKIVEMLGNPFHIRHLNNKNYVYMYYMTGHPKHPTCKYGDLCCVYFSNNGAFIRIYPFYILDDIRATEYWHNEHLPTISYEDKLDRNQRHVPY